MIGVDTFMHDLLRLENIRDMLIDAYMKAYEYKDSNLLDKIAKLMDNGKTIAEELGEKYLIQDFRTWSSGHPE